MSKNLRIAIGLFCMGAAFSCVIALIQGNGQLAVRNVIVLGIFGTVFFFGTAVVFRWHVAPVPIGTPLRTCIIFAFFLGIMSTVCWYEWPEPLKQAAKDHDIFRPSNESGPNLNSKSENVPKSTGVNPRPTDLGQLEISFGAVSRVKQS